MSLQGLQVAKEFGQRLPKFNCQADAEAFLFGQRDRRIHRLGELAATSDIFIANFSPASLKNLEIWYFELFDTNGFGALGISREEFECCMASYFGEVVVRNRPDAEWEVREFAFGHDKFEIGVRRGLLHMMLSRFADHYKMPSNKRRQKIFKMYEQRFAV